MKIVVFQDQPLATNHEILSSGYIYIHNSFSIPIVEYTNRSQYKIAVTFVL